MKRNYLIFYMSIFLLLTFVPSNSQVGVGTENPRGSLDLNSPLTSNLGLVLPSNSLTSNIINPQGGEIAIGTIIYDNTNKCVKYFDGVTWSNCLCDSCGATTQSNVAVDCSRGFSGIYMNGRALSRTTYQVTLTNNSFSAVNKTFQPSDLVLSGIDGITVASVTPRTANIGSGASQVVTYTLSGTPRRGGTLTGVWNNTTLSCTNTVIVDEAVRVAYWNNFSLGSSGLPAFTSQLNNPINYGRSGTHVGNFGGFVFTNITSTLANSTVDHLINSYDVISVGYRNMTVAEAGKIKEFVDRGGVAIIVLDSSVGTSVFNAFGGTGSVVSGNSTATTNNNNINNGTFGDARNISMSGAGSFGKVSISQLPREATVLSVNGTDAQVFLTGADNRAIFFWDEGAFRHSSVSGDVIDTPQEIALHNYISFMLRKKGY